jgi:hypothetical protein
MEKSNLFLCVCVCVSVYIYIYFLFVFRYRNFRTFTAPRQVQFSCLAVDSSGEVVCAGCMDVFEIFVWSMKTNRLLEVSLLVEK